MVQLLLCTRRTLLREAFCGGLLGLPSSCLLLGFCWPKTFFSEFSGVDLSVFLFPPVACTLGPISMDVREREGHDRWPRVGWNIALTAPVAVFVMFTFLFYSLNCAVWPLCLCWISVRSHLWNQGFGMEEGNLALSVLPHPLGSSLVFSAHTGLSICSGFLGLPALCTWIHLSTSTTQYLFLSLLPFLTVSPYVSQASLELTM